VSERIHYSFNLQRRKQKKKNLKQANKANEEKQNKVKEEKKTKANYLCGLISELSLKNSLQKF
jgi:hypothetical protein